MKIGILTFVFNNNYGGILQAYALQTHLKNQGHEATLINVQKEDKSYLAIPLIVLKRILLKYVFNRKDIEWLIPEWIFKKKVRKIEQNTSYFINKYITPRTSEIYTENQLVQVAGDCFDAYVVGSDQVWRPSIYRFFNSAFLGFVKKKGVVKISYAASFGTDICEFTPEQIKKYSLELKEFNAVSVREFSAVSLCDNFFNVAAVQLIDPTLLLSKSAYLDLVHNENTPKSDGNLLVYILDFNEDKELIVTALEKVYGYVPFSVNVISNKRSAKVSERIYPSVTKWIRGFADSSFVFTDSFHGCVFAILFNKPFIVYGNKKRGIARFISILKMFDLESQLIYSSDELSEVNVNPVIDWVVVNAKLDCQRRNANDFLTKYLY